MFILSENASASQASDEAVYLNLRKWNAALGVLHFIQGVIMVLVSEKFVVDIKTYFLGPLNAGFGTTTETVFSLNLGPAVAAFLFMSAIAHFTMAGPLYGWYVAKLKEKINYIRWIEYSFSSSWMLVIIALLCGIFDLGALILIFGSCAVMNLCGMLMEMRNQNREEVDWMPFWVGCIAGILPWIVLFLYFFGAILGATDAVPTFVYGIIISLFVVFNVFPLNMVLQYKRVGKWADYLYGERGYMIMSLVAKTLLAWQVWSGTLAPM